MIKHMTVSLVANWLHLWLKVGSSSQIHAAFQTTQRSENNELRVVKNDVMNAA